jgi:enamine deaminase RidA (YjgF/YER057c/UK114 family)
MRVLGKSTTAYSAGLVVPAGQTVYISGQVALDAAGQIVAENDMTGQTRFIFEQIRKLLEEAGGSLKNVVKISTYVTDMTQYAAFAKVRGETFQPPYPTSTAVEIGALVKPGLIIEIEAIAVI